MAVCRSSALAGFGESSVHSKFSRFAACSKIFLAFFARSRGTGTQFMWQWLPPFERKDRWRSKTTKSRGSRFSSGAPPPPAARHFRTDWMYSQTSSAALTGIAAKLGACSTGTTWQWSGTKPPLSMDTKDSRAMDATRCVSFSLERQNQHPVGGAPSVRFRLRSFRSRSSRSAFLCSSLFAIATVMSRPKKLLSVSSSAFAAASAVSKETWQ